MPDAGRTPSTPDGRTRAELTAEIAAARRTSARINRSLWGIAAGVMAYGAGNVTVLLTAHHTPWPTAWLLSAMVDLGLCVSLWSDRVLHRYGRTCRWLSVLRWITAAMTWALNVAGSALHHDWVGVGIHSCGPVLLVTVAEAAGAIQRHVAGIITGLEAQLAAVPRQTARKTPTTAANPERRGKDAVVADLVAAIHADPQWTPDYPRLMKDTGFGRSWCEKRVAEARAAAGSHLHAVTAAQHALT